ncbi:MAG: oligoendopeptidase F [Tissierellales bacterium]|nr:oligoendopeptidase F [Tissierellales bacterium]
MVNALPKRSEVDVNLTWDLKGIFKSEKEFNETLEKAKKIAETMIRDYKGRLKTADDINSCLDIFREFEMLFSWLASYASLKVSEDQTNMDNQTLYSKVMNSFIKVFAQIDFIEEEISNLPKEVIEEALNKSEDNAGYLKNILRRKPHRLHKEAERVLISLGNTLEAPENIYNMAKLADMKFGEFEVDGKKYPLSFVLFEGEWEYEKDTKIRRKAFEAFSNKLRDYQYTIGATYNTQVQTEKTISELRGFDSVIDFLLFPQEVERELYDRQIDLIMEKLAPHMRKYARLLKKIYNLDEMTFADLKVDVDPDFEPQISVEEAREYILGALGVLGEDYTEMLNRAFDERWIDFVQNEGKSTGAFCSSPYGAHSYILISWTERMREVFVLAHELGHAGHFTLAHRNQSIFNSRPSLYFIEAPSTMNEMLMANYLMKNTTDKRMKRWVISSIIARTYYHNFVTHLLEAHYQREVYKIIDEGGSVNAQTLNKLKRETLEKFWGEDVKINEGAELTWMRQPHYYMGLYPYTYSAGLTIATQVSQRILKEGENAVEDWKNVLKAGGTKTPVELAQMAKVDITTEEPLLNTIEYIGSLIDEIVKLTDEIENEK